MNQSELTNYLASRRSKKAVQSLAKELSENPKGYAILVDCMTTAPSPTPQYAAWVLQHCADFNPEMIQPHLGHLISVLSKNVHNAVKRGILRSMTLIEIPEEHYDDVATICFNILESHKEPVAIRVHAMQILWNICRSIPELADELKLIIESHLPHASAGFKSRGSKIIREMQRLNTNKPD